MGVPVFMEKDRFTGVVQFFGELVFLEEVGLRGDMESELRGEPKPPLLPESLREAFNLPAVPVRYFFVVLFMEATNFSLHLRKCLAFTSLFNPISLHAG